MKSLWKQSSALHPTFTPINGCLTEDWFLLPYEARLQRAHALALRAAGILTEAECASIIDAAEAIGREFAGVGAPDSPVEDIHTWIEGQLVERVGEAGKKIHTARSRNDQVATLLTMFVIDAGGRLDERFRALARVCCRRAKAWSDLVFPLQTHGQFATPGSVGFWALRYASAFDEVRRAFERGVSSWRRACPLGSGGVGGSSIAIDRAIQASELGFDGPSANALYSTSTRDECLELLGIAVRAALHLQSLATDVIAFSQTPFGWTRYPEAFGTGSSMMPNKTNPDAMELLRGECNAILAAHGHAVMLLKGLPSGYNRDLQCIKPVVRDAAGKLEALCAMTAAFVEALDFDADRLARSMQMGAIDATLRMEEKVKAGMPLRDAHHSLAEEVRRARAEGASTSSTVADASAYRTIGGASPEETRRVVDVLLGELE
jgi:argininosuccinate lyase